jgi:hypothetical protein
MFKLKATNIPLSQGWYRFIVFTMKELLGAALIKMLCVNLYHRNQRTVGVGIVQMGEMPPPRRLFSDPPNSETSD